MKGYKTLLFGLAMVILPPALTYLAGIDWTQYLNATWAPVVAGIITIALRAVTTTPIGKS